MRRYHSKSWQEARKASWLDYTGFRKQRTSVLSYGTQKRKITRRKTRRTDMRCINLLCDETARVLSSPHYLDLFTPNNLCTLCSTSLSEIESHGFKELLRQFPTKKWRTRAALRLAMTQSCISGTEYIRQINTVRPDEEGNLQHSKLRLRPDF